MYTLYTLVKLHLHLVKFTPALQSVYTLVCFYSKSTIFCSFIKSTEYFFFLTINFSALLGVGR